MKYGYFRIMTLSQPSDMHIKESKSFIIRNKDDWKDMLFASNNFDTFKFDTCSQYSVLSKLDILEYALNRNISNISLQDFVVNNMEILGYSHNSIDHLKRIGFNKYSPITSRMLKIMRSSVKSSMLFEFFHVNDKSKDIDNDRDDIFPFYYDPISRKYVRNLDIINNLQNIKILTFAFHQLNKVGEQS